MLHLPQYKTNNSLNLYLGSPVSSVIEFYQQFKCLAQQSNHRQLCCLQGGIDWCFEQATSIIKTESVDYQWCGQSPTSITPSLYQSLLGQDVELLILNMSEEFDANMFAAAEGSVSGGTVIILLLSDNVASTNRFYHYMLKQLTLHLFPIWHQQYSIPTVNNLKIKQQNGAYNNPVLVMELLMAI